MSEQNGSTNEFSVTTDKLDYAPGSTAQITATGIEVGGTVEFQVQHLDGAGADGVAGTADDQLDAGADGIAGTADDGTGPNPGAFASDHAPFTVTDGGAGDLDGVANGVITTEWFVRDPDSLGETFRVTATDIGDGDVAHSAFTDALDFDIAVEKTDGQTEALPGDLLTYTITVSADAGAGLDPAGHVTVYDELDPNVTFVSATGGGFENAAGSDDGIPDGAIQWNLGTMAPGEVRTVEVTVQVNADAPVNTEILNTVNVGRLTDFNNDGRFYYHTFDNDHGNNSATDTTTIANQAPMMRVTKWADPATIEEGGDTATFHVLIENRDTPGGDEDPLTIIHVFDTIKDGPDADTLPDQIDLMTQALKAWNDIPGHKTDTAIVLGVGESFEFTFTRDVTLNAYEVDSDHVTVSATTDDLETDGAIEATAEIDGATVTGTNVLPTIEIVKTGPDTIPEGGADVTYNFSLSNTSVSTDPVEIASIDDDTFDDAQDAALYQAALDAWHAKDPVNNTGPVIVLAPDEVLDFDFTATVVVDAEGNIGIPNTHTNTVTVTGTDDEGSEATGSNSHTLTGVDVLPVVSLQKAGEMEIDEGGDIATYEITITNGSVATDPLTILQLFDDKFGDLMGEALAANGGAPIVIQPGDSFTFTFDRELVLQAEEMHANVVTVVAADNEGNAVDAFDCHVVEARDVAPEIEVEKTSDGFIAEGGELQEFTIEITNTSGETDPVAVTEITDTVFGDLLPYAQAAWAAEGHEGPIVLQPGEVFTFSFEEYTPIGNAADLAKHVNAVRVTVVDDEGTEGSAKACLVAEAEDVAPTITVEKSSDGVVQEGGDDQDYSVTITNTSGMTDPVEITEIDDSAFDDAGDAGLYAAALAAWQALDPVNHTGTTIWLDPGEVLSFSYTAAVDITADETFTNTVTVTATDDEGNFVVEGADADTVGVPKLAIEKQILVGDTWIDADGPDVPVLLEDADGKVDYRFVLTNVGSADLTDVTISDPTLGITGVVVAASLPAGGAPVIVDHTVIPELQADWDAGEQLNVASASGHETFEAVEDAASYFGAVAAIDIEKVTLDSPDNVGDGIPVLAGQDIAWHYEVTNSGNVELANVVVTDSDPSLTVVAAEVGGFNVGDADTDGLLDTDETWIYTAEGSAIDPGESDGFAVYHNTGTATGEFTDDAGTTVTATDSDDSSYYVLQGGFITDGGLCDFGAEFDLYFKGNLHKNDHAGEGWGYGQEGGQNGGGQNGGGHNGGGQNGGGHNGGGQNGGGQNGGGHNGGGHGGIASEYKLVGSDPDTVVYNLFFDAGALGPDGTLTLNIPFPFVLVADDPVHAYSDVTLDEECGQVCFQPGEEISDTSLLVTGEIPASDTTNGETYQVEVTGLPGDGFVYLTVELEYSLIGSRPWARYDNGNDLVDAQGDGDPADILDGTVHEFSAEGIANSADSIVNDNHFLGWSWTHGGDGHEKLKGGHDQKDRMFGYGGNDKIKAKSGDDFINGGKGNDKLWGGSGRDTFVFADGDGRDRIMDFEAGRNGPDMIDLSDVSGIRGWSDLKNNHLDEVKNGTWIHADNVDILLKGVAIEDLAKADFLFA